MDLEPSEVVRVCNTNLTGAILCCQKAVRVMRRQPKGSDSAPAYHVYNFGFSRWGASFSKVRKSYASRWSLCDRVGAVNADP